VGRQFAGQFAHGTGCPLDGLGVAARIEKSGDLGEEVRLLFNHGSNPALSAWPGEV